jgi:hypothetical protein
MGRGAVPGRVPEGAVEGRRVGLDVELEEPGSDLKDWSGTPLLCFAPVPVRVCSVEPVRDEPVESLLSGFRNALELRPKSLRLPLRQDEVDATDSREEAR